MEGDPTVMSIACGTCQKNLQVPLSLVSQLLQARKFNCPHCRVSQKVSLPDHLVKDLWKHVNEYQDQQAARRRSGGALNGMQPHGSHRQGLHGHEQEDFSGRTVQTGGSDADQGERRHRRSDSANESDANLAAHQRHLMHSHESSLHSRNNGDAMQRFHGREAGGAIRDPYDAARRLQREAQREAEAAQVREEADEDEGDEDAEAGNTFAEYKPWKLQIGVAHPDPVVETASLAAVEPPEITYQLHLQEQIDEGLLSALQLESIVYASQRHTTFLPDGQRGGFFIGDGAGVGKGRTLAGLILENWTCGRRKHLWLSVGSDLRIDSRRDLDDVGGTNISVVALNKLPYGSLSERVQEGVVFLTYSSLISSSDKGMSRLDQLVQWCGDGFDGLILYDECHKAKNLVPDSGSRATKVGEKVLELQRRLPLARVVYCSATGASEPRNLGYMERLGLWGPGNTAFPDFAAFLAAIGSRGVAALELVAMDLKAQGVYVARTLSYSGAEFEVREEALERTVTRQYEQAAVMWCQLRREFLYAAEMVEEWGAQASAPAAAPAGKTPKRNQLWRAFWAAHQRFFRHMCMASKIPALVRMAQEAVETSRCVVIGLQSTGDARTADVVAEGMPEAEARALVERRAREQAADSAAMAKAEEEGREETAAERVKRKRQQDKDEKARGKPVVYMDEFVSGPKACADLTPPKRYGHHFRHMVWAGRGAQELLMKLVDDHYPMPPNPDEEPLADQSPAKARKRTTTTARGKAKAAAEAAAATAVAAATPAKPQNGHGRYLMDQLGSPGDAEVEAAQAALKGLEREQAQQQWSTANQRKQQTLKAVNAMDLPNNPLDTLIDLLGGPEAVAEMTGRKGRLVRCTEEGRTGVQWEARNASGCSADGGADQRWTLDMINVHERSAFLDGRKLIAVISEAASAGISLHADKRAKNTLRRVHLTLELPWSADKAIQQFGRSHRANQLHAPQYRLLFTPLGGEKRFAAAVARRLESLGALTQGDRRAGPSLHDFNYESVWGVRALKATYRAILEEEAPPVLPPTCRPSGAGSAPEMSLQKFYGRARAHLLNVGIIRPASHVSAIDINAFLGDEENGAPVQCGRIADADKGDVPRFLNRLLGLAPEAQKHVFDLFQAVLEATVEAAKREGRYDDGIVDVSGTSILLTAPPATVRQDPGSQAKTLLYRVEVDRGVSWEHAQQLLAEAVQEGGQPPPAVAAHPGPGGAQPDPEHPLSGFYRAKQMGLGNIVHSMLAIQLGKQQPPTFRIHRAATGRAAKIMTLEELNKRYIRLTLKDAQLLWDKTYKAAGAKIGAGGRVRKIALLSGLVLPVWDAVQAALESQTKPSERKLSVLRLQTTGETVRRLVGVAVPEGAVEEVLRRLQGSSQTAAISLDSDTDDDDLQMLPGHSVQQNLQQRQLQQQPGRPPTWLGEEPPSAGGPGDLQQGAVPGRRAPRTGSLFDISGP